MRQFIRILYPLTLLTLVTTVSACLPAQQPTDPAPTVTPMPQLPQNIRYLALGDSYTIGESVLESARWPVQLANLLAERNIRTDLTLIARTGWTTDELWAAMQKQDIAPPYELVSLLIGVNNQYRGLSAEAYRESFRFLLGKSIAYAGGDPQRVLVLSIPDWGATPFAALDHRPAGQIADEIVRFNVINREETEAAGARYIDIAPGSRDARTDPSLIAEDGLHPSGKMYAAWAQSALPEALRALGITP